MGSTKRTAETAARVTSRIAEIFKMIFVLVFFLEFPLQLKCINNSSYYIKHTRNLLAKLNSELKFVFLTNLV